MGKDDVKNRKHFLFDVLGLILSLSIPFTAASPENRQELLLDQKFVRDCVKLYPAPTKSVETNGLEFPIKQLNIVDPLKYSNNLGKSVTIGTLLIKFYNHLYQYKNVYLKKNILLGNVKRVKHAFTLGARKLRDVLSLPCETIGWRLEKYFGNALERNGKGQRQDVKDPVTAFGTGRSELSDLSGDFEGYYGRLVSYQNNEFYRRAMNASTSMQPNGFQNMGKRRGTGTYIPDMVCDF